MCSIPFIVLVLLFLRFVPTSAQNRSPDANRSGLLGAPKALDDYWDDRFDLPGLDVGVHQVAVGSNTNLYVQTVSRLTGSIRSAPVYRWNGERWNSLLDSNGWAHVDGMALEPQRIMATAGETLYVAMERRYISPLPHPSPEYYISCWDGTSWSVVGGVFNAPVSGMAVHGGNLYVVGGFDHIGSESIRGIARWTGTRWSTFGAGLDTIVGEVSAVAIGGNGTLYVGGAFTRLGQSDVSYLARWDGVRWAQVMPAPRSRVGSLLAGGALLYATVDNQGVWRWDGTASSRIDTIGGGGWASGPPLAVDSLGRLYSQIYHREPGADSGMASLARFAGGRWEMLPGRIPRGSISTIAIAPDGKLLIGGGFARIDSLVAPNIARWDGARWSALRTEGRRYDGLAMTVTGMARSGKDLYVCGHTITNAEDQVGSVVRWDGERWTPMMNGLVGVVSVLATGPDGRLYAGGCFADPGHPSIRNVAWWDGTDWQPLGDGVDLCVSVLAVDSLGLIVGGSVSSERPESDDAVLTWDGTAWRTIAEHVDGKVRSVMRWRGDLYVGGAFDSIGNVEASAIARWDGERWFPLGRGLHIGGRRPASPADILSVMALAVSGDSLIVGGQFDTAGAIPAANIAVWSGDAWSTFGSGMTGYVADPLLFSTKTADVRTIAVRGRKIYAGGFFGTAGDIYARRIAMWDATAGTWNRLGSGIANGEYGDVLTMLADEKGLWVGGEFTSAGNALSFNIAHWNEPLGIVDGPSVSPNLSFGDVNLGRFGEESLLISNPATSTATLDVRLELPISPFSLFDTTRHFQVAPGYSRTVRIHFAPTFTGSQAQDLIVRHNATGSGDRKTVRLEGNGIPLKTFYQVSNSMLDFGRSAVEFNRDTTLMLSNDVASNAVVTFHLGKLNGMFSLPDTARWIVVAPGESRTVPVRFRPLFRREEGDTLVIRHDGEAVAGEIRIVLRGEGVDPSSSISISAKDVEFGTVAVGDSTAAQIVIGSAAGSTRPLSYTLRLAEGAFRTTSHGRDLAAGESDTLVVAFAPESGGSFIDTLKIEHDGSNEATPVAVVLRGRTPVGGVESKRDGEDGVDLSIQPNPASESVRLDVHLARRGRVRMDISTEDGRDVGEIVNGEYGEGDHSISWESSGLPVGVYQVRLHVGEFLVSRKLVIIR